MAIESAAELLTELQADTVFMDLVGTYNFEDGSQAPAIAVLSSMQTVAGVESITGLEVVIPRTPLTRSVATVTGSCGIIEKTFRVMLIQYPGGDPAAAQIAADHLSARVPGSSYRAVGSAGLGTAGDEQISFSLPAFAEFTQ